VCDFPAQRVGHGLRRPPDEGEALVRQRVDQLADGLRTVYGEEHGECVAEFDSAQCSWCVHVLTMALD
jgi:hypothetical protein